MASTAEKDLGRMSPVALWVRGLEKKMGQTFFMASEVAEKLGISVQAVRKYAKQQVCGEGKAPSFKARFGPKGIIVNLYTPEDIASLQEFLDGQMVVYRTGKEE